MKHIKFIFTVAAALFLTTGMYAQLLPVMTEKEASSRNDDGTYTLTLKSYVTGEVVQKSKLGPADIIFAMDISGSMKNNIGKDDVYSEVTKTVKAVTKAITTTTKAMTATTNDKFVATSKPGTVATPNMKATNRMSSSTKNWTFNGVTADADGTANYSHFYKDDNGDYYAVHKANNLPNSAGTSNNVRALWYVDKNGNTWYLTTNGVSSTYLDVTSNTATIWNGTLYKGWTYKYHRTGNSTDGYTYQCYGFDNGNADATVASQWYYLHTDGEYYPVRLANNYPDSYGGNTARVAWVEINGVQWFLHGDKLDTDYDHDICNVPNTNLTGDYRAIWFAPLYKGGWTYSTMIAYSASGSHYYEDTDGKRYPVQKATEEVNGVTTYQAFVEIPGVGKRYLYGTNQLSETPCPFATANNIPYYFGELYTGGWKTGDITDGTTGTKHYYLHTDGEYYPVRKSTASNNHQVYVVLPEGTFYFDGNGLSEDPYPLSPTNANVTFYFGSLYTVTGWTYNNIKDKNATVENGYFYKHTDDKYYPVFTETLTTPTTTYQAYVMLAGSDGNLTVKKYLWGHELHDEPCPYSAAMTTVFYYGTLYTGGWKQSAITVATSSAGGHYYLHTDNEYYPVKKERVSITVDGVTKNTYQVYVELPASEGGKMYLWGHGVHEDPYPYSWAEKATIYFEPLYSGGWSYDHVTAPTSATSDFYKHSDGKYYRVLKEKLTSPSTSYQLYVELPEGKRYLYGSTISVDPYPYAIQPDMGIYFGELYEGGWTYANITAGSATGGHYYLYEGEYYPVQKKKETYTYDGASVATYQAFVELPVSPGSETMVKWYLTPTGLSATEYKWSRNTDGKSTVWFDSLYLLKQYDYSRYEGLRRAVYAFIDDLSARCLAQEDGPVHSRVALVQYANASWAYKPGNQTSKNLPHLKQFTNSAASGNSVVLCDFEDLTSASGVQALKDAMPEGTPTTGATRAAYGMVLAKGLFLREAGDPSGYDYDGSGATDSYEQRLFSGDPYAPDSEGVTRKKILITIGDGEDNEKAEWKTWADDFKANVPDAKVFVVHVQTTAIQAHEKYVASPDETNPDDGSVFHYYYDVKYYDEELIEALLSISAGSGGAMIDLGSTAIVRDVVTPEFSIPAGATIQMYTANCIGGTPAVNPTQLIFEDETNWESFNGTYTLEAKDDGTTVLRVTGFDFSANWCGDHGGEDGYMGKELIIRFPILPKEDIVGGIIPTNTAISEILDENEDPVKEFPIPKVGPFPIHIQIEKTGLLTEDSAVFAIYRKLRVEGSSYETAPYMTVVLTGIDADGSAVTADIVGLDPDYHYKIVETSWSWRYTPEVTNISTETQTMNPFKFKNTLDTTVTTKNGEDVQHNEFF